MQNIVYVSFPALSFEISFGHFTATVEDEENQGLFPEQD